MAQRIADPGNSPPSPITRRAPNVAPKSRDDHPDHATVKQLSPESQCGMIVAQISVTLAGVKAPQRHIASSIASM